MEFIFRSILGTVRPPFKNDKYKVFLEIGSNVLPYFLDYKTGFFPDFLRPKVGGSSYKRSLRKKISFFNYELLGNIVLYKKG